MLSGTKCVTLLSVNEVKHSIKESTMGGNLYNFMNDWGDHRVICFHVGLDCSIELLIENNRRYVI